MHFLGQFYVAQPTVRHQGFQDRPITVIEIFDTHNLLQKVTDAAFHATNRSLRLVFGRIFRGKRSILEVQET